MMKSRWWFTAGVLAFMVGALMLFPARAAYRWFAPPDLTLAGIDGTIWNGRADHASAFGLYVRNLEWQIRPLAFLTARLALDARGELVSGFAEGRLSAGVGGNLSLSDVVASLALPSLADTFNMPNLDGTANIRFERVEIRDGLPVAANGSIEVADLLAPNIYPRGPIGGYRAEFFTQENGIAASVEDTDGVIDMAGSLTVNEDRSYVFLAAIAPKPDADEALRNQMRFLGTPDERGQYELRLEGQL